MVAVDQPVVEVETAKAMVEVPCPYGGVVTARFGEEGTELPVGAPLLTVAVGERAPEPEGSGNVLVGYGTQGPAARRRRVRAGTAAVDGQGVRRAADGSGQAAPAGAPATGRPPGAGPPASAPTPPRAWPHRR
ncbi:dihydrolipoamide acetyltransferase component of pyruvate dehydrogenase complex [Streptomyces canarius]